MNLCEAFEPGPHAVISIVVRGGKTTIVYRLGAEAAAADGRVIVARAAHYPLVVEVVEGSSYEVAPVPP